MKVHRAFLVLLAFAACARTTGPVEIPSADLPFTVARTADPSEPPNNTESHTVYFVQAGLLSEQKRTIDASVRTPEGVLQALLDGPNEAERARGIATEIPEEVRLLDAVVVDGAARVDLSGEFQEPATPEHIALRVAQVVWTLTSLTGIRSVDFVIDGEPVAVTTDNGAAVERRVTREDYARLGPAD